MSYYFSDPEDFRHIPADGNELDQTVVQSIFSDFQTIARRSQAADDMLELNALVSRIKDMRARLDDLRGYL